MGYPDLTKFNFENNQVAISKLIESRTSQVERLFSDFTLYFKKKYGIELLKTVSPRQITALYFNYLYDEIKPLIRDKVNKCKMASLMELIIVQTQPFELPLEHDGFKNAREVNSEFAMSAAFSLIDCMINDASQEFFFDCGHLGIETAVNKLLEDHKLWLSVKNVNEIPVIINSQFYEFLELISKPAYKSNLQTHGF